jgi:hypothetical protein
MQESLTGNASKGRFTTYIKDVILHCTPKLDTPNSVSSYSRSTGTPYSVFVGHLFCDYLDSKQVVEHGQPRMSAIFQDDGEPRARKYSVVTLNYDLVLESNLENFCQETSDNVHPKRGFNVERGVTLAKLHGSVDGNIIVAPTWNKSLTPEIFAAWEAAYRALSEANQIRIIGYSLPVADGYVRYLLKAAVVKAKHLKNIDIVLLDDLGGEVVERYKNFIAFREARIAVKGAVDYFRALGPSSGYVGRTDYREVEQNHHRYFENHGSKLNARR